MDINFQLISSPFDLNLGYTSVRKSCFQAFPKLNVFMQKIGIVTIRIPPRPPRLVVTQTETVGMNLLPQRIFLLATATHSGSLSTTDLISTHHRPPAPGRRVFCATFFDALAAEPCLVGLVELLDARTPDVDTILFE